MTDIARTLVVLGAGGDLTKRLLLPGVGQLLQSSRGTDIQLIGAGFDEMSEEDWKARVTESFAAGGASGARVDAVIAGTRYLRTDVTVVDDLTRMLDACAGIPALYFALPPAVTVAACEALKQVDLPVGTVLALEKPFGTDLASAERLNKMLVGLVPENRIHRVDHFLGKSTVLNVLGVRFANRIFEPLMNAQHVEKVEIVFDEPLALENRAGYYDRAGAMIDMIQSHLLLVLALVAMEPPRSVNAGDLRDTMQLALRAMSVHDPVKQSRRARYTAGEVDGRALPAYVDEDGVDAARNTETLAEVVVSIDNWRWAGVPFLLRSGKALSSQRKEIVITFTEAPHIPIGLTGKRAPERLTIALSPDQLSLDININGEDDPFTLDPVTLSTTFAAGELGPYGEVLAGILSDDPTLSVRGDAVEQCWRIVAPVMEAWVENAVRLDEYAAGSAGPEEWSAASGRRRARRG